MGASAKCSRFTSSDPVILGLLASLLFAILAAPLGGQTAAESRPGSGFGPSYDAAHEIVLAGTIQEVVTHHAVGSPVGMHLLVAGPQGLTDAHVGPFLSQETRNALLTGAQVQMVGARLSLHGKDYLLVRQLTVGGRSVTVRSKHGLLVHERPVAAQRSRLEGKSGSTAQPRSEQ
jgi:hypothetical protein